MQVHIIAPDVYHPLEVWLTVLRSIRLRYPFTWNDHFERLVGLGSVRSRIENVQTLDSIFRDWDSFCAAFRQQRLPFLIY